MSGSRPHSPASASAAPFRAEAALDALDDGYCVVSPEWRILFVNSAFARLRGGVPEQYVGRELWEAVPSLAGAHERAHLRDTMDDGETRSARVQRRWSGGEEAHDIKVTRVIPNGAAIQIRDVSAVVRAERELLERIEENTSLREVACALAAESDLDALLRLICAEAASQCRAAGALVVEVRGESASVIAAGGIAEGLRARRYDVVGSVVARAASTRDPVRVTEYGAEFPGSSWAHEGGELRIGPLLAAPLVAHDEVLGVLSVVRPRGAPAFSEAEERRIRAIADQAALALWKSRLLERMQAANRAKSEFMATMSHELRTPLTALTGYEELMADGILGPLTDDQRGAVERMRWSTQLLTAIIEEILTFSRLEAGEVTIQPQETTAGEILQSVAAVLEPLANAQDLALGISLPPAELELRTDANLVRRILVNIGANAVKFTSHGLVELSATGGETDVRFSVRDTGIGIAPADLARLFQPFSQLEGGLTRRYGGTGLGLYTAQRLAHLLGGRIDVESTPGVGSTFTVVVPRDAGDSTLGTRHSAAGSGSA